MPELTSSYEQAETPEGKPIDAIVITIPMALTPELTEQLDLLLATLPADDATHPRVWELFQAIDREYTARIKREAYAAFQVPPDTSPQEDELIRGGFVDGYVLAKGAGRA